MFFAVHVQGGFSENLYDFHEFPDSGCQKNAGDQLEHPNCSVALCSTPVPAFSHSPRDSSVSDISDKGDRAAGESIGTSWKLFTDVSWENGNLQSRVVYASLYLKMSVLLLLEMEMFSTNIQLLLWATGPNLMHKYSNIPGMESLNSQSERKVPWHTSSYLPRQNVWSFLHLGFVIAPQQWLQPNTGCLWRSEEGNCHQP